MRTVLVTACILVMTLSLAGGGEGGGEIDELRALVAEQSRLMKEQNAKMAAQDARLADLHAKMSAGSDEPVKSAKGIMSVKKNAVVTVGGQVNTKYIASIGEVSHGQRGQAMRKVSDFHTTTMNISEARLNFDIQVNDHFEAFLQLDMQHDTARLDNTAGLAQKYYIHWKNLCESGFGVLVGRNNFIFSDRFNVGQYTGLLGSHGDFTSNFATSGIGNYNGTGSLNGSAVSNAGEGMFSGRNGKLTPNNLGWDFSRTTQINPYWESSDKQLRIDLSLMQSAERLTGTSNTVGADVVDGVSESRAINYGLGSGTFRVMWKPIEGLSLTGSVANFHQSNQHDNLTNIWDARRGTSNWAVDANGNARPDWISSNWTATNLSFNYTPTFAKALTIWGKWTHGWNDGWTKDLDSDAFNLGAAVNFSNGVTVFVQGDYFTNKNKRVEVQDWYKANIWAFYTGLIYKLPYGVNAEFGWRHEESEFKDRSGYAHTSAKVDTVYGHLGFDF